MTNKISVFEAEKSGQHDMSINTELARKILTGFIHSEITPYWLHKSRTGSFRRH